MRAPKITPPTNKSRLKGRRETRSLNSGALRAGRRKETSWPNIKGKAVMMPKRMAELIASSMYWKGEVKAILMPWIFRNLTAKLIILSYRKNPKIPPTREAETIHKMRFLTSIRYGRYLLI